MPRRGTAVHDLVGWLTGATRAGELAGLPSYDDPEAGLVDAETYARRLLGDLNALGSAEAQPMGIIEARGFRFRAWVETQAPPPAAEPVRRHARSPDDPAGRGLDIGKSLRAITKGTQAAPVEDLDTSSAQPAESLESRGSRYGLMWLFGLPFLVAVGLGLMRLYPMMLSWALLALASLGLLLLLSKIVPSDAIRTTAGPTSGDGATDRESRR